MAEERKVKRHAGASPVTPVGNPMMNSSQRVGVRELLLLQRAAKRLQTLQNPDTDDIELMRDIQAAIVANGGEEVLIINDKFRQ